MRPATVSEARRRVSEGQPFEGAMGDLLQGFYAEQAPAARGAMLVEEPAPLDDPRYDALVGGMAAHLSKRRAPDWPPGWIGDRARHLSDPWFQHVGDDPGLREGLTFVSPGVFESRNAMTDDEPPRRANTPRR